MRVACIGAENQRYSRPSHSVIIIILGTHNPVAVEGCLRLSVSTFARKMRLEHSSVISPKSARPSCEKLREPEVHDFRQLAGVASHKKDVFWF